MTKKLTPWQVVQLARHPDRPHSLDLIPHLADDFVELHGDRLYADDPAVVAGFGRVGDRRCLFVGQQKGRGTEDSVLHNFGMARPEGYRKAQRLFELAERFGRPIVTLIDTPGAYHGIGAEKRGQARAVATTLMEMASIRVPVVATVTGEGGSGGALALGVANRVLMLEHAIYSVMSPEGCASILFRDAARSHEAAEALQLTAPELLALGIVDEVLPEPGEGAHEDVAATAAVLREAVVRHLASFAEVADGELAASRTARFRSIGVFHEGVPEGLAGSDAREAKSIDAARRKQEKEAARLRERVAKAAREALARGESATSDLLDELA